MRRASNRCGSTRSGGAANAEAAVDQHTVLRSCRYGAGAHRRTRRPHRRIDDAAVAHDDVAVQRDRAAAHRRIVVSARGALAAALRIRTGGEQKIAGEAARRGTAAFGRIAIKRHGVPAALGIQSPAQMRDGIRIAVIRALAFREPVAHQSSVEAAFDLSDVAFSDLEAHRVEE